MLTRPELIELTDFRSPEMTQFAKVLAEKKDWNELQRAHGIANWPLYKRQAKNMQGKNIVDVAQELGCSESVLIGLQAILDVPDIKENKPVQVKEQRAITQESFYSFASLWRIWWAVKNIATITSR